jgi:KDO2-lipid IV(A) lauroyltransferase
MSKPKHYVEYILLRTTAFLINAVPLRVSLAIGWGIAALIHFVFRFRVKQARARIREVFGVRFTEVQIRHIAWRSWRNVCFNAVEIIRMQNVDRQYIINNINHVELERIRQVQQQDGEPVGAVIATPHMGNWDLGGVAAHVLGIPFFFIARRQKNELTDAFLNRMRGVTGVETIMSDDQRMFRKVIKKLKKGMVFAILPDVRARTPALTVDYLHGKANLAPGMALFARMASVPVIPTFTRRIGWTHHDWKIFDPIYPDPSLSREEDYLRITQAVMDLFTSLVEQYPDQYFWYNKRWVLDPL